MHMYVAHNSNPISRFREGQSLQAMAGVCPLEVSLLPEMKDNDYVHVVVEIGDGKVIIFKVTII